MGEAEDEIEAEAVVVTPNVRPITITNCQKVAPMEGCHPGRINAPSFYRKGKKGKPCGTATSKKRNCGWSPTVIRSKMEGLGPW